MPKKLSEDHNNSLRRENGYKEKRKKSTKKDFIRVKNGYICPFDRFMRLVEIKKLNVGNLTKKMLFQIFARQKSTFLKPIHAKDVQISKTANIND